MGQSEFDDAEGLPFVGGVMTGIELEISQCPVGVDPPLLSGAPPVGFDTFARILVNSAAAIEIEEQVASRVCVQGFRADLWRGRLECEKQWTFFCRSKKCWRMT